MKDLLEAITLFEDATPENPVKLRIKDGAGQHVDILVTDATVKVNSYFVEDECQQLNLTTGRSPEDDPYWDEYWDGDGPYGSGL